MTPKQKTLKRWPGAACWRHRGSYMVYRGHGTCTRSGNMWLGVGTSPRRAWADAARNL